MISIDVKKKVVDLEVSEEQITERKARLQALPAKEIPGRLGIYKRVIKPLSHGAVLVDERYRKGYFRPHKHITSKVCRYRGGHMLVRK